MVTSGPSLDLPNAYMNRRLSAKKAWARVTERAERGEKFGFIACLGILYKAGIISRAETLKQLNEARITREDLVKFREHSTSSVRCFQDATY